MASERLSSILSHLKGTSGGVGAITSKNADDVVLTCAVRTPLTKAFKGGLKDTPVDILIMQTLQHLVKKSNIDPALVEDICCGNVNEANAPYKLRAASLAAGFPNTTSVVSINRFCSSGLVAIQQIANQITTGSIDIGVGMGVEQMSLTKDNQGVGFSEAITATSQDARDCSQPMGQTSENVAKDFNVTREAQDKWAEISYQRAEAAQKAGLFDEEIVPITTQWKDPKTGEVKDVVVKADDGIRYGTTYASLSKIRPAFPQWGDRSTGGNSSQVTDGAAAVLLMKRSTAEKLGQPILAKFCGATVAGLPPRIMGIGPSIAVPKLLQKFGLTVDDIDLFELNEAFASMAVYCIEKLKIDPAKVNPRGGAIALGHPLGATGARQVVTGLAEARRQKKKVFVNTMCIGTGMGMAGLWVNEVL
ncbi:3-ketoacyl-CoA thiolase [Ascodesmis nigricans]|uniref:3-ketoacyl-CoA thiolase n=1 Tax=Ascodesmis nigricans TaxID=341454 RepID=A0A4S2MPM0_9PEZI|nr:3-ketoacyl-CoA thiolase [Ascodesmis nigricans]